MSSRDPLVSHSEGPWLVPVILLVLLAAILRGVCDRALHLSAATPLAVKLPLHIAIVLLPCSLAVWIIYRRRLAQQPASSPSLALTGAVMIVAVVVCAGFLLTVLAASFFAY